MRIARVSLNQTCNQRCAFCHARRDEEQTGVVRSAPQRVRDAAELGGEVVLTGGEPGLRRDLDRIVAYAKKSGATKVTLETNATLIDEPAARKLRESGLDVARVHLPAWGDDYDRLTGMQGGFGRLMSGVDALTRAGLELEVSIPIVAANADTVHELPRHLEIHGLVALPLVVGVPCRGAPDRSSLATLAQAVAAIERLDAACRSHDMRMRLETDTLLPPCQFQNPQRSTHLYSLSPGAGERPGYLHVPECAPCRVRDRCPGFARELLGGASSVVAHPILEDRTRRRLTMIASVDEQIERELVTRERMRGTEGDVVEVHTIRVGFRCNQACEFCFVSTHLPAPGDARVREAIAAAGRQRAAVALSGGEPTLNPRLAEYVALCKEVGVLEVELQTNAIRLGDGELVDALVSAGLDLCFVSLHGPTAEISDRVTSAPGTFERSAAGIDQLHARGVRARLNFVMCEANAASFPQHVRLVAKRWPDYGITLSFVAPSTDLVPRTRALIPRYTDIMPALEEGLRLARELGVRVTGFESMCGIPVCLKPDGLGEYANLAEVLVGEDMGEFVKPPPCRDCEQSPRCHGLRRGYAELYGYAELRPVTSS